MSRKDWPDEKIFDRLFHNKSNKTYWQNISVLRQRPTKNVFSICVKLAESDKPHCRIIAYDILAQLGLMPRPFSKQTIELLFQHLETEDDPTAMMSLLYAIGHHDKVLNRLQVDQLCALSATDDSSVKEGLLFALNGIDNAKAILVLIMFSKDKLSNIRNWATFGLGSQIKRNTRQIRSALWDRVNDKHQETKLEAIAGLAIRKDMRVSEIIKRELIAGERSKVLFDAILDLNDESILADLKCQYDIDKIDKEFNPEWLKDLQSCIQSLARNVHIEMK